MIVFIKKNQKNEVYMYNSRIGYVAGVFDLFHVGHLNIVRKAKEHCDYLIAGVLTDELVMHFKNHMPVIPFEERIEILRSIRYVDEAVSVTFENIDKMDAWKIYHFDYLFSGDDYRNASHWIDDQRKLQEVGSDIVFFPYTQSTSSTMIRKKLK